MNRRHPDAVQEFSQRVEEAWPLTLDPSPRAIGTERGCVEDQPQRVGSFEGVGSLPRAAAGRGRHSRAPVAGKPFDLKVLLHIIANQVNLWPDLSS